MVGIENIETDRNRFGQDFGLGNFIFLTIHHKRISRTIHARILKTNVQIPTNLFKSKSLQKPLLYQPKANKEWKASIHNKQFRKLIRVFICNRNCDQVGYMA